MLCWFIYYTSHTAQFETYAFVSPGENINFRYDNITNEYLEDKDLTVEEISRQFENNAMDYVLFDEFFSNQNKVEFNDIDDLYASFSKNTSDGKTKYSFIYNDYKFDDMEELVMVGEAISFNVIKLLLCDVLASLPPASYIALSLIRTVIDSFPSVAPLKATASVYVLPLLEISDG